MIAREGYVVVGVSLLAALAFLYSGAYFPAAAAFVLAGVLGWLHASPRRAIPASPRGLLSPVDGRVCRVEPFHDPWLDRDVLRIGIEIRPPGITVLHSVIEGKIKDLWTAYGPLGESQLKHSLDASPDCYALFIQTDEDEDVVIAVSSRWPLSRCRFDKGPGERVGQGSRIGFVYFASAVDVLVPSASPSNVAPGDRVRAIESILGQIRQEQDRHRPHGD